MEDLFIVADIGGTNIRVALADSNCNLLVRYSEPTYASRGPDQGIDRLKGLIRKVSEGVRIEKIRGIVIAAAGPLDPQKGVILTPPSLPTWENVAIKSPIAEEFGMPVFVQSDADMAALGEHRFGVGQGLDDLIYITVSTGIGGGIITGGEVLYGSRIAAAEIGHMVVDPQGPLCNCGGRGHVEALASGTAIARMASEMISSGRESKISDMVGNDLHKLNAAMVAEAARDSDVVADEVIRRAGSYLGIAIVNLIHIFDPQLVIIGGGVSNDFDLLIGPINDAVTERIMPDYKGGADVVRSALGDDSGIFGAIAFGLDKLG